MRTTLAAGLIAAASVFAVAAPAQASCFYNKSDITEIRVKLDCGTFCSNNWIIPKADYNCRGGQGGYFTIAANTTHSGYYLASYVEERGYVTVTGSCATGIKAQVWRADHTLLSETAVTAPLSQCR